MSQVKCVKCDTCIQRRGWHGHFRRVETLTGHQVLIQEQFQCNCIVKKTRRKFSALSFLFDDKGRYSGVTEGMRLIYPIHLTRKSRKLLSRLLYDAVALELLLNQHLMTNQCLYSTKMTVPTSSLVTSVTLYTLHLIHLIPPQLFARRDVHHWHA